MIPEGVVQIGDYAFCGCSELSYIGIPKTVIIIGNGVLENCNNDVFIIGEKNTETENVAKQYNCALIQNSKQAIDAFNRASTMKSQAKTKSFDIFGEKVTCSNTLTKYYENLEYYSDRKKAFYSSISKLIPQSIHDKLGDLPNALKKEQDNVIKRLADQGVFVKPEVLNSYIAKPYDAILVAIKGISEAYISVWEGVKSGIDNNNAALIREAESKVTGLSYGVIGDGLDMLAYSIDEFLERKKQREVAYEEAERKSAEFNKQYTGKGEALYTEFIKKTMPYLNQGTDMLIESLCKAENDQLMKAGLIDADAIEKIDIAKSAQLMDSITNNNQDNSFVIALALKNYPCNMAAYLFAKKQNYTCAGLTELISFLGIENKITQYEDQKKTAHLQGSVKAV